MWKPQLQFLEEAGYPVVAPHVYGVEGSPERPGWSMADYAHELAGLLDHLGHGKAVIVGLSMGGYQAFEFFLHYPEKTASLVLCDTRAEADSLETSVQRSAFRSAVELKGPAEAVRRMLPNFFAAETYASKPELVSMVQEMIERQPARVISEAMRAIAGRNDSTDLLRSVGCPALLMNGTEDKVTPPSTAHSMHRLIPGSTIELIPHAGHLSNLEQPETFNRLLLAHLRAL
jgi:non-heme chloroperoxidase